jgi:class 3 adenylate cyclase
MGLDSGEVVVGKIGDDLRMGYTALGHAANLAARMEQIAALAGNRPELALALAEPQLEGVRRHRVAKVERARSI